MIRRQGNSARIVLGIAKKVVGISYSCPNGVEGRVLKIVPTNIMAKATIKDGYEAFSARC
jgi:hypothetical protein